MKTAAALLIALAMTCAVAAQVNGATSEERAQALQPSTTQPYGSIIVYSQIGVVDQPTLERWRVTWDVVKRWFGFTDPNVPPPISISLLTVPNFRVVAGQCGTAGGCGSTPTGTPSRIYIAGFNDDFPADKFRFESPTVNHELIHVGVFWLLAQDERYYPNDFAHRSPGLASVIQWAMRVFYDHAGPDPTPGTFERERYQQMVAVAREMLGEAMWDDLFMSSHLVSYEEMSQYYLGYEQMLRPGSGEEGVATTLIRRMIGRVSMHNYGTRGYETYQQAEWYLWHEVNRECQARGVVCSE